MGEGLIVRRGGGGSGKPEGAYVWKKCDKPLQGTVHLTQITDGTTPMTVQLSSDVVDLSTITAKSLVGLTLYVTTPTTSSGVVTNPLPITSETTHTYAGNTYGISYDTTNYQLKFTDLGWSMGTWKDITLSNIQTVLDYVVSDDPTAYPDGGLQGGYWYEKVVQFSEGILFKAVDSNDNPTDLLIKSQGIRENQFYGVSPLVNYCETCTIEIPIIRSQMFYNFFQNFSGKLKIKTNEIQSYNAFSNFGRGTSLSDPKRAVWIPSTCETIAAADTASVPFYDANTGTVIYCEASSKPSGWSSYWYYVNSYTRLSTMWGITEEQFDAL